MLFKFALVALAGLLLSLIVLVAVEELGFDYRFAMLLRVTGVPLFLFWPCKCFGSRSCSDLERRHLEHASFGPALVAELG